jgi:transcriptional regulator with GAF, ATPase, and Fis domain
LCADAASPYFGGYTWPGNVRELENIIERIVVLARGDEITLNDLPDFLRRERPAVEALHLNLPAHGISLEAVEKELIVRALDKWQPDSRRSVPGYQSQDADLSHGEVRAQEGTRRFTRCRSVVPRRSILQRASLSNRRMSN